MTPTLVWFRQDLRLADQPALFAAAGEGPIVAVYVLDDETPGAWRIGGAQRWWLHHSLAALGRSLADHGVSLILRQGPAARAVAQVAAEIGARRVHAIRHFEPWWQAAERDLAGVVELELHGGNHLADPRSVRTGGGGRYRMFTPFWRALRERLPGPEPLPIPRLQAWQPTVASDALADWQLLPRRPDWAKGFDWRPGEAGALATLERFATIVRDYHQGRNLPSIDGSSRLSPHLHHGEVSPATVAHALRDSAGDTEPFLRELGWRDFTANIIDQRPDYALEHGRAAFGRLPWRSAPDELAAWQRGRTGYPIVDAGMRQLWTTGWMHNRVRMIAASFLVKHLLIDWREGQRWFWDTLVDADYGNNAVNWQWVAGTGDDSSPFGRIMAPLLQSAKFDAAGYIRRWVPELAHLPDGAIHDPPPTTGYPEKLIGHREGRERALSAAAHVRS